MVNWMELIQRDKQQEFEKKSQILLGETNWSIGLSSMHRGKGSPRTQIGYGEKAKWTTFTFLVLWLAGGMGLGKSNNDASIPLERVLRWLHHHHCTCMDGITRRLLLFQTLRFNDLPPLIS